MSIKGRYSPAPGGAPVGSTQRPLRVAVADELRERIIAGQLRPGVRLFEEGLAAEMGVSRNPVREALQLLSSEGFVSMEPRRGARVGIVDQRRAQELFELRLPLERTVAQLAAQRRTPAQLAHLEQVVAAGMEAIDTARLERLPALNTKFHDALAAAAHNELLAETLRRISHVVQWVYSTRLESRATQSWGEHGALLVAISDQDGERAAELGVAHIEAALSAFLNASH